MNLEKARVSFRISWAVRCWLIAALVYALSVVGSIGMFRHINNCPNYQHNDNLTKFAIGGELILSFTPIVNTLNVGVVFVIDQCVHLGDSISLKQLFKMK
jgi:hypothetical protein